MSADMAAQSDAWPERKAALTRSEAVMFCRTTPSVRPEWAISHGTFARPSDISALSAVSMAASEPAAPMLLGRQLLQPPGKLMGEDGPVLLPRVGDGLGQLSRELDRTPPGAPPIGVGEEIGGDSEYPRRKEPLLPSQGPHHAAGRFPREVLDIFTPLPAVKHEPVHLRVVIVSAPDSTRSTATQSAARTRLRRSPTSSAIGWTAGFSTKANMASGLIAWT